MITATEAHTLSQPDDLAICFTMGQVEQTIREAAKRYQTFAEVGFETVGHPGTLMHIAIAARLKEAGFRLDLNPRDGLLKIMW